MSQTNLSCKAAHTLLCSYKELRTLGATQGEILSTLSQDHTILPKWEKELADEIWGTIISAITLEAFFGIAVDAGIDKVLSEHVLVGILYVGSSDFLLPPMYHPKRKAFNGKETAEILIETLSSIIGIKLVAKLRYMTVDG